MSPSQRAPGSHDDEQSPVSRFLPWAIIVAVMVLGVVAGWFLQPWTAHRGGAYLNQFDKATPIASLVLSTLATSLCVVSLPRRRLPYASLLMLLEVVWIHLGRLAVPVSSWTAVAAALWAALLFACVMAKRRLAAAVTVLLGGLLTVLLVHASGMIV